MINRRGLCLLIACEVDRVCARVRLGEWARCGGSSCSRCGLSARREAFRDAEVGRQHAGEKRAAAAAQTALPVPKHELKGRKRQDWGPAN